MEDMSMEKIMSLAQLFGEKTDMSEIMKAVSAAQNISTMMNLAAADNHAGEEVNAKSKAAATPTPLTPSIRPVISAKEITQDLASEEGLKLRQIKAITSALPFLDREYQKSLFLVVKLLEINSFQPNAELVAMEKGGDSSKERRLKMVSSFENYLNNDEQQKMKLIMNAIKASSIMK